MGAGIAVHFVNRFPEVKRLRGRKDLLPGTCQKTGRVFNLITKEKSRYKPSYQNLEKSLIMCKNMCWHKNIEYLAMPKIGCGLDGLEWHLVRGMIKRVFSTNLIDILICYLEEEKDEKNVIGDLWDNKI
jgi:hypothetical protein